MAPLSGEIQRELLAPHQKASCEAISSFPLREMAVPELHPRVVFAPSQGGQKKPLVMKRALISCFDRASATEKRCTLVSASGSGGCGNEAASSLVAALKRGIGRRPGAAHSSSFCALLRASLDV